MKKTADGFGFVGFDAVHQQPDVSRLQSRSRLTGEYLTEAKKSAMSTLAHAQLPGVEISRQEPKSSSRDQTGVNDQRKMQKQSAHTGADTIASQTHEAHAAAAEQIAEQQKVAQEQAAKPVPARTTEGISKLASIPSSESREKNAADLHSTVSQLVEVTQTGDARRRPDSETAVSPVAGALGSTGNARNDATMHQEPAKLPTEPLSNRTHETRIPSASAGQPIQVVPGNRDAYAAPMSHEATKLGTEREPVSTKAESISTSNASSIGVGVEAAVHQARQVPQAQAAAQGRNEAAPPVRADLPPRVGETPVHSARSWATESNTAKEFGFGQKEKQQVRPSEFKAERRIIQELRGRSRELEATRDAGFQPVVNASDVRIEPGTFRGSVQPAKIEAGAPRSFTQGQHGPEPLFVPSKLVMDPSQRVRDIWDAVTRRIERTLQNGGKSDERDSLRDCESGGDRRSRRDADGPQGRDAGVREASNRSVKTDASDAPITLLYDAIRRVREYVEGRRANDGPRMHEGERKSGAPRLDIRLTSQLTDDTTKGKLASVIKRLESGRIIDDGRPTSKRVIAEINELGPKTLKQVRKLVEDAPSKRVPDFRSVPEEKLPALRRLLVLLLDQIRFGLEPFQTESKKTTGHAGTRADLSGGVRGAKDEATVTNTATVVSAKSRENGAAPTDRTVRRSDTKQTALGNGGAGPAPTDRTVRTSETKRTALGNDGAGAAPDRTRKAESGKASAVRVMEPRVNNLCRHCGAVNADEATACVLCMNRLKVRSSKRKPVKAKQDTAIRPAKRNAKVGKSASTAAQKISA